MNRSRAKLLSLALCFSFCTLGCSYIKAHPLAPTARDTAAALKGAIEATQAQYLTSCTADPKQASCVTINRAVSGQRALITAVIAYCGWNPSAPPADLNAPCVPVSTAQAGLQTAISDANLFVTELKGLIKP